LLVCFRDLFSRDPLSEFRITGLLIGFHGHSDRRPVRPPDFAALDPFIIPRLPLGGA
jgi:hypothetical protein